MTDPTLRAEQQHLANSRAALAAMHDHVSDWQEVYAADHVSTQYLRQQLYRRKLALQDDPTIPLFFGRLEYDVDLGAELNETLYIGRRHVTVELGGTPMVIDWRAPMSLPFYQARPADPMGVRHRRRFGFQQGNLTAYEDENLTSEQTATSAILRSEIERPRTGPMRDIVATIQPDQDVLVRTTLEESLCIQGAPGTGKTAVGLHRAAYLLYTYRDQLKRSGVLVIGPNDSFLRYIGDVLPALGEIEATQRTLASLLEVDLGVKCLGRDESAAEVIKGDIRFAEVIHQAIYSYLSHPSEALICPVGHRIWRVPAEVSITVIQKIRNRGVRYEAARQMLPQQLAHHVLLRMEAAGESPDDRVQNAVARTKQVKEYSNLLWPKLTAKQVIFRLLSDRTFLESCAQGLLSQQELDLVCWSKPPRSAGSARWSLADLTLIDEATDVLNRTHSLGHVIIDEAQDLSPMQLRALGRRASTGSVTLLGDLAQATTAHASTSWPQALAYLGKPETAVHELIEGFRVPAAVIDYAAQLLPTIAPGLTPPYAVRQDSGELQIEQVSESLPRFIEVVAARLQRQGTVGAIVPDSLVDTAKKALEQAAISYQQIGDEESFNAQLDLVPASLAKGLEFDHVVLLDPMLIVEQEADNITGLRRLYVCLTRAVTSLAVIGDQELPDMLRAE